MAAGIYINAYVTTATTGSCCESTGFVFNRSAIRSGTSEAIPIPTTTGTVYSYAKYLGLAVYSTDATTISNRCVMISEASTPGLRLYRCTSGVVSAYSTPEAVLAGPSTSGDISAPWTTDGSANSTYWTLMTTSYTTYSSAESSGGTSGICGGFLVLGLGVGSTGTYTGGPGSAIAMPNILIQYDEA